nr:hypothetical protein [uncultured Massilia sp.]
MKKTLTFALLLCCSLARAFEGSPTFSTNVSGVEHTLALSHWQVDGRGVPSFDYVYEQHAGACQFRLAGHATAMFEEVGGKVELNVFNPEDEQGRELPQVVLFHGPAMSLTLPYEGKLHRVGLTTKVKPEQKERACAGRDGKRLSVLFQR